VAHWLRIPMFSTAGCSDSKCLDEQAAIEATLSIMAAGLSGANLIHDIGFLESALIGSHEMVVLSDEVVGMVKRFLAGVRVDDETLAVDVVKEVGPGGNFLAHEHTVRNLRRELWFPKLIDRQKYDSWQKAGALRMGQRIQARVDEILKTHQPPPLDQKIDQGIDKILKRADKEAKSEQAALR
jgi:trimethylamine--corrinoid protein Co-methyltransferase